MTDRTSPDDRAFAGRAGGRSPVLTRRRALALGAAGIAGAAGLSLGPARSGAPLRPQPGQHPADADRDPGFPVWDAGRRRNGACDHRHHHCQSQAQRLVRTDRSGGVHREDHQHGCAAALCRLARHQRPGARHRAHRPPARRPAARPISGCGTCSAAAQLVGQQLFRERRRIPAASPTSFRTRSTSG